VKHITERPPPLVLTYEDRFAKGGLMEALRSGSITPDIHEDRIVAVSLSANPVSPRVPPPGSARPRSAASGGGRESGA